MQRPENLPTREAQVKLVAGLEPVVAKTRLLRKLGAPKSADGVLKPVPGGADYSATTEGKLGYAALEEIKQNIAKSDWDLAPAPGKERIVFVDNVAQEESELEFDKAQLAKLAAAGAERGINNATAGDVDDGAGAGAPIAPDLDSKGWSNGTDNRVMKPINATYPIKHPELMRIGELDGGGCTGALVGRRLVLTAAHCVVPASGENYNHTYRARRSGAQMPFGSPVSVGYWYSADWKPNGCNIKYDFDKCAQHDWALLLLGDNAWDGSPNGTPGWMGYWYYGSSATAAAASHNNNGYPAWWSPGAPTGIQPGQPYGQLTSGTGTGYIWPHDGVPSYYRTNVDSSGGHSGSPDWSYSPGSAGPYVLGIAIWEHCSGALCASEPGNVKTHPNGYRAITPAVANFITAQRVAKP